MATSHVYESDAFSYSSVALPELIEAAVRSGQLVSNMGAEDSSFPDLVGFVSRFLQVFVHELHGHRSFADRRSNPFD